MTRRAQAEFAFGGLLAAISTAAAISGRGVAAFWIGLLSLIVLGRGVSELGSRRTETSSEAWRRRMRLQAAVVGAIGGAAALVALALFTGLINSHEGSSLGIGIVFLAGAGLAAFAAVGALRFADRAEDRDEDEPTAP